MGIRNHFFLDGSRLFYYNSGSARKRAAKSCQEKGGITDENDVSAEKKAEEQGAWVPQKNEDGEWQEGACCQEEKG